MNSNINFKQFFMIFDQEDAGYGLKEKKPSGYLKIQIKDGKGRLEGQFADLNPLAGYKYKLYLITIAGGSVLPVEVKEFIPGKLTWEFDPLNVGGSGKSIDEFNVAAVQAYKEKSTDLAWPLVAYRKNKVDWKNETTKILKTQINKSQEVRDLARQPETDTSAAIAVSQRPKPANVLPKPTDKPVEIKQLKTKSNKFLINPDRTFTVEVSAAPINFKNRRGKLQDIDNTLIQSDEPDFSLTNKENSLKAYFADNSTGGKLVRLKVKESKWIDFVPDIPFTRRRDLQSNGIQYANRDNSINLNYYLSGSSLKEEIIFLKPPASNSFTFTVTARDLLLQKNESGQIWILDGEDKEKILRIIEPTAFDEKGEVSSNIALDLKADGDAQKLIYTIDSEWLKSAQYPVRIDPTVTETLQPDAVESRDTFVSEAYPNNKYYSDIYLHAGKKTGRTRAFIKFQYLPRLGPNVKRIKNAYLKLYMTYTPLTSDNTIIDLYPVVQDWQSSAVDWNHQPSPGTNPEASY